MEGGAGDTGNLDRHFEQLRRCESIKESEVRRRGFKAREILRGEGDVPRVDSPVTVRGDIHGEFCDLKALFGRGDLPAAAGAEEARSGPHDADLGGPESWQLGPNGLCDGSVCKYSSANVWRYCTEVFDYLPLSAHGRRAGFLRTWWSVAARPDQSTEIPIINRKQKVPHDGPMCAQLWSDQEDMVGLGVSTRGAGFFRDVVAQFNATSDLDLICRAHQLVMEGYGWHLNETLFTLVSTPYDCYKGATWPP
ncbi:hypothetical protein HPB48_002658 [Haemaphysalis longicornis]|uniref:protein-serine/threonine phosphatase n=1 Tax=Haemaphysalis longicornis TaxID=44386 RepID=A0A9J6G3P4_HAELO|nr:hypothetical protein HPB48_002658 [Haemaphysalis longicornis]